VSGLPHGRPKFPRAKARTLRASFFPGPKGPGFLYEVVGIVKAHVEIASGWLAFFSIRAFDVLFLTKARTVNPAVETGSTNHLFGRRLPTMIRSSDAPTDRGSKAPNQPSGELAFTRKPVGLPCMRTSRV
jgi:hypothetical protein